jgi:hypothetical protein
VLPKTGLVVSERGGLQHVLCKPKILPLKSASLKKIEVLQQQVCSSPLFTKGRQMMHACCASCARLLFSSPVDRRWLLTAMPACSGGPGMPDPPPSAFAVGMHDTQAAEQVQRQQQQQQRPATAACS